jgi:hypothetical protein
LQIAVSNCSKKIINKIKDKRAKAGAIDKEINVLRAEM